MRNPRESEEFIGGDWTAPTEGDWSFARAVVTELIMRGHNAEARASERGGVLIFFHHPSQGETVCELACGCWWIRREWCLQRGLQNRETSEVTADVFLRELDLGKGNMVFQGPTI